MSSLIKDGELRLFGTIVPDEWIWPEDTGLFSAQMVIDALATMQGDVTMIINSDGGYPSEAEAIRVAVAAHPGKVTARVTGNAHSAASLMIMSAATIEMSAGSLMLVHDPSFSAHGNPAALTAAAGELNTMADAYAGVYAARAGIEPEAAREIMRSETMFTAQTAVDAGFADAVIAENDGGDAAATMQRGEALAAAHAAFNRAHEARMKFEAQEDEPGLVDGESQQTGPVANQPKGKVTRMSKENSQSTEVEPEATSAPTTPAATPAPDAVTMQADTLKAERARVKAINEVAAPFMTYVSRDQIDGWIEKGTPLSEVKDAVMATVAAKQPGTSRAEITRDEGDTQLEGMIGALMHRANPSAFALEGPATEFRGLRLKSLAMHLAGTRTGFSDIETVRAGLRSTAVMNGALGVSDFAYITTEVLNRSLRAAYERRASTWRRISRQRSASDFRELHSVTAGGDFELKPVNEMGEYLQSSITDEGQGLKLAKYGRQINISFEAVVNDDMGVFERLPTDFARAAGTLESKLAWSSIRANATTGDGTALFHADHGNLGAAGVINVANVGEGRKAMWEQRPFGSKDKDEFLNISPDLLYVPPALEVAAGQFVSDFTPAKTDDVNPFGSTLTPVVEPALGASAGGSDSRWYLFASDMPILEHAYLDGYEAPTVMTKEGMNPDGVNMVARHIFAAVPVEFRGAYRRG